MAEHQSTEVTIRVNDLGDLFRERDFDPFTDDVESLSSLAQIAQLPHLAPKLRTAKLQILLPQERITPQTEALVRHALQRYCEHMITEARRKLVALRWVGLRGLFIGVVFFGISLAASTGAQRMLWIPENLRLLVSESLVVAGWVVIWQPLDSLVQGWWPHWEEERTFKAMSAMQLSVHADH
jgi:hypothetical protein